MADGSLKTEICGVYYLDRIFLSITKKILNFTSSQI